MTSTGTVAEVHGFASDPRACTCGARFGSMDAAEVHVAGAWRADDTPEVRSAPVPDAPMWRQMAAGHRMAKGHALRGHLESTDGGQIWHLVRECCR